MTSDLVWIQYSGYAWYIPRDIWRSVCQDGFTPRVLAYAVQKVNLLTFEVTR